MRNGNRAGSRAAATVLGTGCVFCAAGFAPLVPAVLETLDPARVAGAGLILAIVVAEWIVELRDAPRAQ